MRGNTVMSEQYNFNQAQDWVDKLAAMNSDVTKNDIMAWANQVPLIPLDQFETVPLFLYGDATLDKAITELMQHGVSEPVVNEIYGVVSKTYKMDPKQAEKAAEEAAASPEALNDLPVSNNQPGDWNAVLDSNPPAKLPKSKSRVPSGNVNRERIGDLITVDKYKSAHQVNAQDNSQNAVNFARAQQTLAKNPALQDHGFEVCDYDSAQCLISNGGLNYTVDLAGLDRGEFIVEDDDGITTRYNNPEEFIQKEVMTKPPEYQNTFSRKHFANEEQVEAGVPVQPGVEFTMAQLANIMTLFQNDLLYMHHHAVGNDFDKVHSITQELYEKAGEQVDVLAEMALRLGEQVGNLADAQAAVGAVYDIITEGDVDIDRMEAELNRKGSIILGALKRCRQYGSEVMSKLDELIYDWATEIEYKNEARMKHFAAEPEGSKAVNNDLIKEITRNAIAVADKLTSDYENVLLELSAKTNLYETKCQMLAQKKQTFDILNQKIEQTDDEETLTRLETARDALEAECKTIEEEIDELLPEVKELLDQQKEFEDVSHCKTPNEYKRELSDLLMSKEEAEVVKKNYSVRRIDFADDDKSESDRDEENDELFEKARNSLKDSKDNKPSNPLAEANKSFLKDREKLQLKTTDTGYQHLKMLEKVADEDRKRKLQEIFIKYDRDKAEDEAMWHKDLELKLANQYLPQEVALGWARQDAAQAYNEANMQRMFQYEMAKKRLLDQQANLERFKQSTANGMVDLIVREMPHDKVMSYYNKMLGNNLINKHPMLDNVLWNGFGTLARNTDIVADVAKAALAVAFSNSTRTDRKINQVSERLLRMGFTVKQLEPVTSGRLFARIPEECLDVDSMTKEAITHITGSVQKGRKLFSQGRKKNFSNETYELVNMSNMPARYKFTISNPRYNFTESCWTAGEENGETSTASSIVGC